MKPKNKSNTENLKNKNKVYHCWNCDTNNVMWTDKAWVCRKCFAIHTSVVRDPKK